MPGATKRLRGCLRLIKGNALPLTAAQQELIGILHGTFAPVAGSQESRRVDVRRLLHRQQAPDATFQS